MIYFEGDTVRWYRGFIDVINKLGNIFPYPENTLTSCSGHFASESETFLQCCGELERLFFLNSDLGRAHTFNGVCFKNKDRLEILTYTFLNDKDQKAGLIINMDVSTNYVESSEYKHMPVVEEQLKVSPTHFLKIYTIDNLMIVYTNKDLPFETFAKLKLLQLNVFKDNFETPQQEVMDFVQAAVNKDVDKLNEAMFKIMALDAIQEVKEKQLETVFRANYSERLTILESEIQSTERKITQRENELCALVTKVCEAQDQYKFLKMKSEEKQDNTALLKFLRKNPYIKDIEKIDNRTLKLYYEAPLVYYDDYIAENIRYSGARKRIINIFLNAKYELMTRCEIFFDTVNFSMTTSRIGAREYIGHPHIDEFGCKGTHERYLHECKKTNDFLMAFEQITAAVLNLNFADPIVIDRLMINLIERYTNLKTWRNKETGEFKTTKELLTEEYRNEKTQTE